MTKLQLLNSLKGFCQKAVKDMKLPVKIQQGDKERPADRPPNVYMMRLPDSKSYDKLSPYIIIQPINSRHARNEDNYNLTEYSVDVRFVFSAYCDDEQEGAVILLNMVERVEQEFEKAVKIGELFLLDEFKGLEDIFYYENTAPFFGAEVYGTFKIPPIEREVDYFGKNNKFG